MLKGTLVNPCLQEGKTLPDNSECETGTMNMSLPHPKTGLILCLKCLSNDRIASETSPSTPVMTTFNPPGGVNVMVDWCAPCTDTAHITMNQLGC